MEGKKRRFKKKKMYFCKKDILLRDLAKVMFRFFI